MSSRAAAEVARGRAGRVVAVLAGAQVALRVGVEQRAMVLDRRAHRPRMRREEERRELSDARVERELGAHAGPGREVLGRRVGRGPFAAAARSAPRSP